MKRIQDKLLLILIIGMMVPMLITEMISLQSAQKAQRKQVLTNLDSIVVQKSNMIDQLFAQEQSHVQIVSQMPQAILSIKSLIAGFEQGVNSPAYQKELSYLKPLMSTILRQRELRGIYAVSAHGDIIFSLDQRSDFGSNLFSGKYNQSQLAIVAKQALASNQPVHSKFSHYAGDSDKFSAFVAGPIIANGKALGAIVFQLSPSKLDFIVKDYTTLKQTGETVLAKLTGDKAMFISPLRFNVNAAENVVVELNASAGVPIQEAVQGVNGRGDSVDYRDTKILASWRYLPKYNLGIVVKIDEQEAFQDVKQQQTIIYLIALGIAIPFLFFAYVISRRFTRPIIDMVVSTNAISNGDLEQHIDVTSEDEIGQLASSINEMSAHINRAFKEEESNRWLQQGIEQLSETMRGNQISTDLSDNIVAFVSNYLNAKVGSLYIVKEQELELAGGFAFVPHFGNQVIAFGDGLVGQSAISKQVMMITEVPEDYASISSSLGEITPKNLMIYPVIKEDVVIGVIELGWIGDQHPQCLEFLDAICESVGTALSVADSHHKLQLLLDQSQQQMEELQVREEELRAINEEVEQRSAQLAQSQKELERQSNELQTTNDALEQKTLSLESQNAAVEAKNKQIEQSKQEIELKADQLEASSRYKSEFLANMSHELRTPLNSMLILSRILADNDEGNLDGDQIESALVINNSGQQLLTLINDILDLSKIEAGKMEVNFEPFSLVMIANELNAQFQPIAKEKGLNLVLDIGNDLPSMQMLDVQKTQQILKNLLSNALKFTDSGDVCLRAMIAPADTVFVNESLNQHPVMSISVIDSGIGISEEKTKAIFEAFQQADGSTSRKYGGTGLGLTISRHLTELIDGELSVTSETNVGSTFSLHIPMTAAEGEQISAETLAHNSSSVTPLVTAPVAASAPETTAQPVAEPTKILETPLPQYSADNTDKFIVIIEDDVGFSKVLAQLARKAGFDCVIGNTGKKGLALIKANKTSGVILDLGLPDMQGDELLDLLKKNDETKDIPVHIISGQYKSKELTDKGAAGFHQKPIDQSDIRKLLSSFIKKTSNKSEQQKIIIFDDSSANAHLDLSFLNHAQVETQAVHSFDELSHSLGNADEPIKGVIIKSQSLGSDGAHWLDHSYQHTQDANISIILFLDQEPSKQQKDQLEKYACHVILDGSHSTQRLHDEVGLFLSQFSQEQSPQALTQPAVPAKPAATKPTPALVTPPPSAQSSVSVQGCNVLLVDDDLRNTFALSKVLKKQGMIVTLADNGQMALDTLYANDAIDIVLMDIMMPVMDGHEAMTRIRQNDKYATLPIIALTAKAMQEDRRKCVEAGASDYLTKPVDVDKLVAMMKVWLYQEVTQE